VSRTPADIISDGHNDFPISLRGKYNNKLYDNDFQERFENGGLFGEFDAPRLEKGKMGGAFWSVWAPCPANVTDFSDHNYEPCMSTRALDLYHASANLLPAVRLTLEQIDLVQRLASLYPSYFTTTHSTHAAHAAFKSNDLISPLGIEGLHQIGNSASILRLYQSLGVRYATLTWNCHNRYADAAIITEHLNTTYVSKPLHHGLSAAGRDLVLEMNRIGMLVDISHVSTETMRSALIGNDSLTATDPVTGQQTPWKGSLAPPIFSHSSARAICPHPRNVADDVLLLVKKRNGIVMVNFNPDFISCSAPPADSVSGMPVFEKGNNTLAQVVRHIMHIGDLIGYEHVGLGSDFDGIEHVPEGLEDVSKYPDLVAELLRKGVSKKDVKGVVGENILRVWKEAEKVSEMLKSKGARMLEDNVYWPEK